MKKTSLFFIIIALIISSIACNSSSKKTAYTEEFPYLPKHEGIELEDFQENKAEGEYSQARYIVKGSSYENFLSEYQKLLENDGWEVIQDEKPQTLSMGKENHIAVFLVSNSDNELRLLLVSK